MNLINNQPDIDKIYLYKKNPYEAKYRYLISKHQKVVLDHSKDPKASIEYSNDMQDVYKNIEDYNLGKKRKVLIVFDDMIADMINNKKLNPVVTELFIRDRKLNISIAFISSDKWGLLVQIGPSFTEFWTTYKVLNTTKIANLQKTPLFKVSLKFLTLQKLHPALFLPKKPIYHCCKKTLKLHNCIFSTF